MSKLKAYDGDPSQHIAIIGMTGRFPGAKNIAEFWQHLHDGVESLTFFTNGLSEGMEQFDAAFFNITPREAELLDPQQRLLLECAWELMEQAGYDSESYKGRVAVFGSANLSTYLIRNILSRPDLFEAVTQYQAILANDKDSLSTRISYKLGLTGPSLSVGTTCTSSLVAIHFACQALLNYQCDLALAGAVSILTSHEDTFIYQEGGMEDPDGHCRAFDARANGTVNGNGLGLIAIKRLEDALDQGDTICAVIRSTAVNNDGDRKHSYAAPSIDGQADVITEALDLAEVSPETITYVEAHGTGTLLGDPVEVAALSKAFRGNGAQEKQYCAIGSVKTNIGHLAHASSVVGLVKTVLAMQHKQLPPSLHFETPNPEIDFANSPFFVNASLREWKTNGHPRRAGVNAFGIGGTNAHSILEEAPEIEASGESRPWQLLVLSAKTGTALEMQTSNLTDFLQNNPDVNLADVAFTLQVGRRGLACRRTVVCQNVQDAIRTLKDTCPTAYHDLKSRPQVAFIFPDATTQGLHFTAEVYQNEPTFREQIDTCAELFAPRVNGDLRQVLHPQNKAEASNLTVEQPEIARAAVFAVAYALAKLWISWGIEPQAMMGMGVGEYVAACLAGVFSIEDAAVWLTEDKTAQPGRPNLPKIPLVSGKRADWLSEEEATDPGYWRERWQPPRPFDEQVQPLLARRETILLEVGIGQALFDSVKAHSAKAENQATSSLHPDAQSACAALHDALGQLWLAGVKVDWNAFHAHEHRHRIPLPTYPFERQAYWIEPHIDPNRPSSSQESAPAAKALTYHPRPNLPTPYQAPRSETEQTIADIWQNLIGIEKIGAYDNFLDLGGDSLLAVQIITRVRETLGMNLPLTKLFEQPTVASMASYIETLRWMSENQDSFTQEDGREEIEL